MGLSHRDSDDGGGKDSYEQASFYISDDKGGCDGQAYDCKQSASLGDASQLYQCGLVTHYYSGILQTDKSDEKSYADGDGFLYCHRYGIDHGFSQICDSQKDKYQ